MFNLVDHFNDKINKNMLILTIIYPLIMLTSLGILIYTVLLSRIGFTTNISTLFNSNMCNS